MAKAQKELIVKYWAHKKRLMQLAERFVDVRNESKLKEKRFFGKALR